jgi:diguanylate cyclase (GGDEF)-like protein/PAS domain S-box-containing protein
MERGDTQSITRILLHTTVGIETRSVSIIDRQGRLVANSFNQPPGRPVPLPPEKLKQALDGELVSWIEESGGGARATRFILTPLKGRPVGSSEERERVDGGQPDETPTFMGAVLIELDQSFIRSLVDEHLHSLLFVNGITFLALLIMLWAVIRISFVRPLNELTQTVRGGPTSQAGLTAATGSNQIRTLAESFTHMTDALRASEALNQAVLNSLTAQIAVLDKTGAVIAVNAAWDRLAGDSGNPLACTTGLGTNYLEVCRAISGAFVDTAREALIGIQAVLNGSLPQFTMEYPCPTAAEPRWCALSVTPLSGDKGGAVVSYMDITERKRADAALREREAHFHAMADTAPVMVWMSDAAGQRTFFNKPWLDFTGRSLEQERGDGWRQRIHPDDVQSFLDTYTSAIRSRQEFRLEYRFRRADGQYRWVLDTGVPRFTPGREFAGYIGSCMDMTDQKQTLEEQGQQLKELEAKNRELDQMAIRDPLTGLYNRRFFDEALGREWRRFQRTGEAFTVIIMDVDAFKRINDEHGHEAGDRALQLVGTALRSTLRESDLTARVGGDEFAALLPGTDMEHSGPVIEKLGDAVGKLGLTGGVGPIPISLSVGAATVPGFPPVTSPSELLRVADKRMYESKRTRSSGKADPR